jgi:signal transduction histidine kinase
LVDQKAGLFAVRGGVAHRPAIVGLASKPIFQIFTDRERAVWLGYFEGGLAVVDGKAVRTYSPQDGMAEGTVQAIAQDQAGAVWVGTRHGLSRFQDGQWTTWGTAHGIPEEGVRCILEDNRRDMWIVTAKGISRLSSTELRDSRPGAAAKLSLNLYGQSYGLRLGARANMANPRGVKAADGMLWIATEDGVAIVDPERVQENHVQPPVVIEEMAVDGNQLDVHNESPVGFRGRLVRITYSGLSLVASDRVRFRYKLEGLDPNWIDAGAVRTAVYGNLAPGPYRFRVTACNNDEVWNEDGAVLAFRVEPYFYQTRWFLALCVCLAALGAWAAHHMRMRRLATHFRLVAQERSRLTRELHDSLLQGFAAVIYKLEAASKLFDVNPDSSRLRLGQALDQAEQSLVEARLTIQSMRLPELENNTLPEALRAIAKRLTESTSVAFDLEVMGHVQQLPYDAQAGAYFICREAITNSVNHAGAKRIWAKLNYAARELRLIIQDDGCGFDPNAVIPKPGHVGLAGMRERAVKIGASLKIESAPGQGSVVEVIIPRK